MSKQFISFEEMGYKENFYNAEGIKHLDNNFIGVYGNETAYCDSVTGKIFVEPIFWDDGTQVLYTQLDFLDIE